VVRKLLIVSCLVGVAGCEKKGEEGGAVTTGAAKSEVSKPASPADVVVLTMALAPADGDANPAESAALGKALAEATGFEVTVTMPGTHSELIGGMRSGDVQVAYLPAWAFLKAHMTADADLLLAAEQGGQLAVDSHWYVMASGKIDGLEDLRGKRVAFTRPTSPSGFLFPYAKLVEVGALKQGEDLNKAFANVYFAGSPEVALKSLLGGQVDAAAASSTDLEAHVGTEDRTRIRALSTQGPAPTAVVAVRADMKPEVRAKLKAALSGLDPGLTRSALGADKLVERSHGDHMMALQSAQETVGTEFPLQGKPEGAEGASTP